MLSCNISPNEAEKSGVNINKDGVKRNALELLAMNNVGFGGMVKIWPEFKDVRTDVIQQLSIEAIYSVYLEKQNADIVAFKKDEDTKLPEDFDYDLLSISLSNEVRNKLKSARPLTIGAASRIPGITPAAIAALILALKKRNKAA